ncbi:MAG: GNAT family N-acetyltransferase [Actinobacteria bacterium]|nr:GNAT family N-acetyltransferase [Actinomycetota bacterium]
MAVDKTLEIRSSRLEDAEDVLDLWLAYHAPGVSDTLEDVRRLIQDFPNQLLVAKVGDGIVGAVIAGWDGWRGHLHHLAVRPEFRRQGIARALLEEAERQLIKKGAKRISVLAERENREANAFCESLSKLGYELDTWMHRYTKRM